MENPWQSDLSARVDASTTPYASAARYWGDIAVNVVRANWRAQGAFLLVAATIVAARLLLMPSTAGAMLQTLHLSLKPFVAGSALAICGYLFFKTLETRSLSNSFAYLWSDVFTLRNTVTAIPAFFMVAATMNCFTMFKSNIPEFRPYELDVIFAHIDRALHFGVDPWRITEYAIGYGSITKLLDTIYYLWFFAVYISVTVCIGTPANPEFRHRFLLSFVLIWSILGIACATALSSAGPIYFDRIYGGPSAFSALIKKLTHVTAEYDLTTMIVREALWLDYKTGVEGTISGISAMPSLHNAMCVLLVLAARNVDRGLSIAAAIFALLIFIGSVHLGWHYAIDAYVSLAGVLVIWKLAGFLTRKPVSIGAV